MQNETIYIIDKQTITIVVIFYNTLGSNLLYKGLMNLIYLFVVWKYNIFVLITLKVTGKSQCWDNLYQQKTCFKTKVVAK